MTEQVVPLATPPAPGLTLSTVPAQSAILAALDVAAGTTRVWLRRVSPSGESVYVRGAFDLAVSAPTTLQLYDYEAPLNVPLTYYAEAGNDASELSVEVSAAITLPSTSTESPWIVDLAQPANSQPVTVEQLAALSYAVPSGVHRVLARRSPIVLSNVAGLPTFELGFATATEAERVKARATLGSGTPFLLKTPPEQGVGNIYASVIGWNEQRAARVALYADRRFRVQCQQVDRPDPTLVGAGTGTPWPPQDV